MTDDKPTDDAEMLEPDAEPAPPPQAKRSSRRRDDHDDDEYDDRDDDYHRGRKVHYDEDGSEITSEFAMWAVFAHIGVFLLGFIAPLVIWIAFRHKSPFVVRHAKE